MNFKTILVHLANDEDHGKRLALGIDLAKRHGAHLVALFVTRPIGMAHEIVGRGASALYLAQQNERALKLAAQLEQEFKQTCGQENLTYSWIVEDGEHLEGLAQHAHAADLVIVSRGPNVHLEDRVRLRLAEELTMVSGLPVLVLPTGYSAKPIGKRVLIAWKGTREAVRAIGDALPFLTNAQRVILASVAENTRDALSHLEVHQHLERHGVPVESLALQAGQGTVGDTLLQAAHDHTCDMIVLGAYSRARWREVMFGGVTRELFNHTTLPLLMSR